MGRYERERRASEEKMSGLRPSVSGSVRAGAAGERGKNERGLGRDGARGPGSISLTDPCRYSSSCYTL